jgi:hypothetical protein
MKLPFLMHEEFEGKFATFNEWILFFQFLPEIDND